MKRTLLQSALFIFLFTAFVHAADAPPAHIGLADATTATSQSVSQGGLSCFSIVIHLEEVNRSSCDYLCAAKGAACTAITTEGHTSVTCADPPMNFFAVCRCCSVAR